MHVELRKELKQFERELSVLVARFLKIYDEFSRSDGDAPAALAVNRVGPSHREGFVVGPVKSLASDVLSAYA